MAASPYLSTDPHAGVPYLSTDPHAGEATFTATNEKDATGNAVVDPNTVGTFASHFVSQINPIPVGQLLPFPQSLGGGGLDAPLKAAQALLQAQGAELDKAKDAYHRGDYIESLRHALGYALPVIGPILDKAGGELQQGQYAAGAGDALGLAASLFGPESVSQGFRVAAATGTGQQAAEAAEKGAQARAVDVMAPQVGPNKVRFGNMAADVGPDVLRQTTAKTRGGLLDQAETHLQNSYDALDASYDAVPNTRMYGTAPVKRALQDAIQKLTVTGVGGTVEPANRAARIGALRQALNEVKGLGNLANLDNLRGLRKAWDEGAKAIFTPSTAQDFLKARGTGHGWADARSVLNDYLVSQHPELAPLNANAHLWKSAVDVMQAAEEADRVRPKVGRAIMARGLGAAVGSSEGPFGAAVGAISGPIVERALASLAPAQKIIVGRQMAKLAEAIRAANLPKAQALSTSIQAVLKPALAKAAQAAGGGMTTALQPAAATVGP